MQVLSLDTMSVCDWVRVGYKCPIQKYCSYCWLFATLVPEFATVEVAPPVAANHTKGNDLYSVQGSFFPYSAIKWLLCFCNRRNAQLMQNVCTLFWWLTSPNCTIFCVLKVEVDTLCLMFPLI